MHFFRDDTGDGPIRPVGPGHVDLTTLTAHREAEKLIESANAWTIGIKYIFLETEQGVSNTKMIRQ